MIQMHINPDKIREVIGSGGKVIQKITADTGCKIDIDDDGSIFIASSDIEACRAHLHRLLRHRSLPRGPQDHRRHRL